MLGAGLTMTSMTTSTITRPSPQAWARWTFVTFFAVAFPSLASAELGGDVASVQTDRARMRGALVRITSNDRYSLHEMQTESGTLVREYVSPAGKVFAVAWQGPLLPDLRQVLGPYFERYVQGAQAAVANRTGRAPLLVELPDLVVQNSGRQRAFTGRAYVPQMVPQGVTSNDIQ
jgi:hypothetical protein